MQGDGFECFEHLILQACLCTARRLADGGWWMVAGGQWIALQRRFGSISPVSTGDASSNERL